MATSNRDRVGKMLELRTDPAERHLDGSVRERRLDSHVDSEPKCDTRVTALCGAEAADRQPEESVIGSRGKPVEQRIEERSSDARHPRVDRIVEGLHA